MVTPGATVPGGLEDLMVTNWPGSWESKAQACGMALSHLEHLGQDGRGTETPTRPAIKETEDQRQGQMRAIWFSFQCHPCCTTGDGLDTSHTELTVAFIYPFCRSLSEAPDKNQVRKPSPAALQ